MRVFASLVVFACAGCAATAPKALVASDTSKQEPKSETKAAKLTPKPKRDDAWHGHIPIGFWDTGICLGNSKDWNGLRLNWADAGLGTINGVNATLWIPDDEITGSVNGIGLGIIGNGAEHLRGAFAGLIVNVTRSDMVGAHIAGIANASGRSETGVGGALIVNAAGDSLLGVHFAGVANAAGLSQTGIDVALIANAVGVDRTGISVAGIATAAGDSTTGVAAALIGTVSGRDTTGLSLAGIGDACGRDMTGIQLALGSVDGGRSIRGITIGGAFITAGGHTDEQDREIDAKATEIDAKLDRGEEIKMTDVTAGMEPSAPEGANTDPGSISGIALTAFRARAGSMTGLIAALGNMTTDEFTGLGISICTRVEKSQSGVTVGGFNHAERIDGFGFQLGLLNHIPTNPTWARWLPLVNWQM